MNNFKLPKEAELADFLLSMNIFREIDPEVVLKLLPELEIIFLRSHDILFQEGDPGEEMYMVYIGRVRVYRKEKGEKKIIAELGAKEGIGEISVLTGQSRVASVIAIRDTILIKFSKKVFEKFAQEYPKAALTIAKRSLSRATTREVKQKKFQALVIIPMSSSPIIEVFMGQLLAALEKYGTLQLVTEQMLSEKFGDKTEDMLSWLSDLELRCRYIIYLPKYGFSKFTHFFISQSDQVYLINDPDATKEMKAEIEENILDNKKVLQKVNLIILKDVDETKFEFMHSWISRHKLSNYYHVVLNRSGDVPRLARAITGNSVGLVLAGGGALGLAHIGVLRALEEMDIPIDVIGGTSAGALIAGLYAMGNGPEQMQSIAHHLVKNTSKLKMTIPFVSLTSGDNLVSGLKKMYGQARVEDLSRHFFCISTNLTNGNACIHDSGLLWKAVRASVSLPGIYPPVLLKGCVFADGAILNNLPVDVMLEKFGVGKAIAARFESKTRELSVDFNAYQLSGWKILLNKLNPFGKKQKIPGIGAILLRSFTLAEEHEQIRQSKMADLCISLKMKNFKLLDYDKYREIIAEGYEQAKIALKDWRP